MRRRLLAGTALAFVLGYFVVVPRLDALTGGAFSERFANTNVTHRDTLAKGDLQIWFDNFARPSSGAPSRTPSSRGSSRSTACSA
jgi:hypothetical protein